MPRMRLAMRSGWKVSKSLQLLAHRGEGDGPAHHLLHRQGGAAPGVAVELGEDHAVEVQGLVERLGGGDGVLAGHGVDDEERVVRAGPCPEMSRTSCHQLGVDAQAAGGVDDQHVAPEPAGLLQALGGHRHRVGGLAEHRHAHLAAQHPSCCNGRRALEVGADQQRLAALLLEPAGQLAGGGGLARALEAGQQHQYSPYSTPFSSSD